MPDSEKYPLSPAAKAYLDDFQRFIEADNELEARMLRQRLDRKLLAALGHEPERKPRRSSLEEAGQMDIPQGLLGDLGVG